MIAQYVLWGCGATTVTHTARHLRRATHGGCVGNRARAGAWKASAVMTAWSVRRAYLERGARLFATGAQHAGGMVFAQRRGCVCATRATMGQVVLSLFACFLCLRVVTFFHSCFTGCDVCQADLHGGLCEDFCERSLNCGDHGRCFHDTLLNMSRCECLPGWNGDNCMVRSLMPV
jgi:hypothetical protein